jgi:RHS repeat-associated protein
VESRFEYDASQRLRRERLLDSSGTALRDEQLAYDLDSNLVAIDDLRPTASVPAASPRRTTARFDHDELHRLVRVSYGEGGSGGAIDYELDALGNLLRQSTPAAGQPGHLDDPAVDLGAVGYQGGRSGRQGRRPGHPPGPHALTSTANGHRLEYDANGNVTLHGAARLTWDFEDRLERHTSPESSADYRYDHKGRRVIRSVVRGQSREETWSIDPACEVRQDGTLVKYAFLDGRRVARIQGSLDPAREIVQSQRLVSGWNLVAAAVETSLRLRDAFGADAAVYEASGASSYSPVDLASPLQIGRALWVHVPTARVASWRGLPRALAAGATSPAPLHAWPRLEAFRPALHLTDDPALLVFDGAARRWLRRDPSLPAFLSDAPVELGSAQAFWSPAPIRFQAGAAEAGSLVFYHTDSVGSIAAMTDASGALIEERTHYPFGALRSSHRPGAPVGGTDFDFTGHERDRESGLVYMGARSYLDLAGVFLSPDPRFTAVAALGGGSEADQKSFASFLANPQMGNLYSHALRQPLKYIDPTGLEVAFSKALAANPTFKHAWRAFASTPKGQEVLELIEDMGGRVYLKSGNVSSKLLGFPSSNRSYNAEAKMGTVTLNAAGHGASPSKYGITSAEAINNLARDIHRELIGVYHQHMIQGYRELPGEIGGKLTDLGNKDPVESARLTRRMGFVAEEILDHTEMMRNPSKDSDVVDFEKELNADAKPK